MSERNYAAEMRAIIDAETAGTSYSSPVVAEHIVTKLRATDPDLLDGWLHSQAEFFIRHAINLRDCSTRTHARTAARRQAFGSDAKRHAGGESTAMVAWLNVPFAVEDGTRKRLGDLTADDLTFVADTYDSRARENAMTAAFLRALRKRVGRKTVADHFTDEQLNRMWLSLTSKAA